MENILVVNYIAQIQISQRWPLFLGDFNEYTDEGNNNEYL
jgi:hypothetical protein